MRKIISFIILAAFCTDLCVAPSYAQVFMPKPGQMVALSPAFHPSVLAGVKVYKNDPFRFDFILDKGDIVVTSKDEARRLIGYFLASLTVPEKDLWVNLSPYEKDRIVPDAFGLTEMGRDLLAQDYLLKQITSSLMYPEDALGKEFWSEIYKQAQEQFGTTDIPLDTFNKVWITPAKAIVYEKIQADNNAVAYVIESPLKVMLEADYLAAKNNAGAGSVEGDLAQDIIRKIILPSLEKEVNEGKNFARLRQIYHSFILAAWYKKKMKQSLLAQVYVDQQRVQGVNIDDPRESEKIWGQYVEAFKKGVFNFVKEERDTFSAEIIPRKYFSGGLNLVDKISTVSDLNPSALPNNAEIIRSKIDAAGNELPQDFLNKIQDLKGASFEHKTMTDFLTWVEDLIDARGQPLTDKEIDLLSESFNIKPWTLNLLRNDVSLQAKISKEFLRSLPDDGKVDVYLMRDALLLYQTEKTLGKGRPYAAYLSKEVFRSMAQGGMMADQIIPIMMSAVSIKLGFPVRGQMVQMIPGGKLKEFKEEFFKLYNEMLLGNELEGVDPRLRSFLTSHRGSVQKVTKVLKQYIRSLGISDEDLYSKGVRYIDTTMRGTFPLFLEAVTRSYFEQMGYVNVEDKTDTRMLLSVLSEEMSFLKPGQEQVARVFELGYYPVRFSGQLRDGIFPEVASSGEAQADALFILRTLLFQKELEDKPVNLLRRLELFMEGGRNAVPHGVDAMGYFIDAIKESGSPLAVYKDRIVEEYLKDEELFAIKLAPEKPGDPPTMLKIFLGKDLFN